MSEVTVKAWKSETPPTESSIEELFRAEGLSPSRWSNGPGDRYAVHSHSYHKVLYCVRGTITFNVEGKDVLLVEGDRIQIPPGTSHSAVVGSQGVTCMEAAR